MDEFEGRGFLATAIFLTAQTDDEGAQRSAISRAYYACFHRARDYARRSSMGIRQDGSAHVAVRRFLEERDQEAAFELKRLHTVRKRADYDIPFPDADPVEAARSAIELATTIIAAIDALDNDAVAENDAPETQEE